MSHEREGTEYSSNSLNVKKDIVDQFLDWANAQSDDSLYAQFVDFCHYAAARQCVPDMPLARPEIIAAVIVARKGMLPI